MIDTAFELAEIQSHRIESKLKYKTSQKVAEATYVNHMLFMDTVDVHNGRPHEIEEQIAYVTGRFEEFLSCNTIENDGQMSELIAYEEERTIPPHYNIKKFQTDFAKIALFVPPNASSFDTKQANPASDLKRRHAPTKYLIATFLYEKKSGFVTLRRVIVEIIHKNHFVGFDLVSKKIRSFRYDRAEDMYVEKQAYAHPPVFNEFSLRAGRYFMGKQQFTISSKTISQYGL